MRHLRKIIWLVTRFLRALYSGPCRTIVLPKTKWERSFRRFEWLSKHTLVFTDDTKGCEYDFAVPIKMSSFERYNREGVDESRLISPSKDVFELLNNKESFYSHFSNTKLKKYLPRDGATSFPLIAKPKVGANSEGCELVRTAKELRDKELDNNERFIFEEFIVGNSEYACHAVVDCGKILDHLTIEYVYSSEHPIKGEDLSSRNVVKEKYLFVLEQFLKEISYSGICCFNYKVRDGVPVVFEINPRIGGSFCEFFLGVVPQLSKIKKSREDHA